MTDVNLRNVSEELMRRVKAQAALQGVTMRQFVIDVLQDKLMEIERSKERGKKPRKQ